MRNASLLLAHTATRSGHPGLELGQHNTRVVTAETKAIDQSMSYRQV